MNQHPRPSQQLELITEACAKPGGKLQNQGIATYINGGLLALLLAAATLPAAGQMATASTGKFVGNVLSSTTPDPVYDTYWNQVTPENSGKWESVEATRDVMNWTQLDYMYAYTRARGIPFKLHTLVWGQQYPSWITSLTQAEQREEVEEWIAACAARYPGTEFIDVVNESLPGHAPAPYRNALGGAGTTGWDWVIWSFEKARQYFPNAKLHINDYSIISSDSNTTTYLTVINLLKDRGLIDGIGEQAHFYETTSLTTLQNNLNRLTATGLPIYISELDINLADDTAQSNRYQQLFPIFWTNPSVRGITFWGYKQGAIWRTDGYLLRTDGSERPAMTWMKNYIAANPQSFGASVTSPTNGQGLSNVSPVSASAAVTYGTAPFTVTFQRKLDSETNFTTVSSDTTEPYTADLGNLPVGTYQVRVIVTDGTTATVTSNANTFSVFPAAGGTWLGTSGNWNDSAIWADGTIANGADATASFTGVDIAADQTITLNGNRTIGNIVFTDATTPSHNLTISGADTLTLDLASATPVINVTQADRRLTVSSVIAGNDGLQKAGLGTLTLSGGNTYSGTTTISAGELRLEGASFSTAARNYSITSGAVMNLASGAIPSGTTTISGGGTLRISTGISADAAGKSLNLSLGAGSTIDIPSGGGIFNGGYQAITWTGNLATLNVSGSLSLHDGKAVIADALTGGGTIESASNDSYGVPNVTLGVNNGSGTFSGTITAAGTRVVTLTKSGTGTQTFSGSTTFRGTTTINGGGLHFAKANSLYAGVTTDWVKTKITVNNGCTIAFNVGGTNEFTPGNVTALLSGLGGTVTNNGLRAGSTIAFDTSNASGGTFTVSDIIANTTGTGGGAISLRKLGPNTLVLSNTNTFTGSTSVDQGTLAVTGSLGATAVNIIGGTLAGNGNFDGNVTIAAGAMHSLAVAATAAGQDTSVITGTLAMAESTLNLTAASTPAAGVYVLATATVGITGLPLFINYNGIDGTVSVDTASTPKRLLLTVNGSPPSLSASVTAPANGQILSNVSPVTASATVTYGTAPFIVTFQNKLDSASEFTTVSLDETAPYTADLGNLPAGTYQIRVVVTDSNSATVTSAPNTYTVAAGPISLSWDGGTTDIAATGDGASGGGNGTWDTTIMNWDKGNGLAHAAWNNATNDTAIFGGTPGTVSLGTGVTVGGLTFASAYTVNGNTITFGTAGTISNSAAVTIASALAGTGPITKTGAGTLNLSGPNSYTGTTVISTGILTASNNTALGSSAAGSNQTTITATGASAGPQLALSGNINSAENITITGNTDQNQYNGVIHNSSGTNTLSGSITLPNPAGNIRISSGGGELVFSGSISQTSSTKTLILQAGTGAAITINNAIANNNGALNILGSYGGGASNGITLKAASAAIGATTVMENGLLKLGVTDALKTNANLTLGVAQNFVGNGGFDFGKFDLAGFNQTVNALNGTKNTGNTIGADSNRVVTNSAASGTSILTVGNGNGSGTFNGVILDGVTAAVALTKTGTGTQTLSTDNLGGSNNYSGVTTISAGILAITHGNALGSTAGNTTIAASGAVGGAQLTLANSINSAENITITGSTEQNSYLSAILSTGGNNTLSGTITLNPSVTGGMRLGTSAGSLTFSGSISQTGTSQGLVFFTSNGTSITVNNAIANNGGALVIYNSTQTTGTGTVTLKGVNGVGGIGETLINQTGILKLGVTDALNTSANLTIGVATTTAGFDYGTFDLAGFNQTVNALNGSANTGGTIGANDKRKITNSAAGTGTNTLTVGNNNGTGTFNGVIIDGATAKIAVVKNGSGTQTLAGVNTYSGNTTVNGGTLTLNNPNANNQSSTVTIASTGALLKLNFAATDTVEKLFIGSTQYGIGEYGHTSSGATNGGLGVGMMDAWFAAGTGKLSVTSAPPVSGYAAWRSANSTAQAINLDHDNDGVANGVEFFLGGTVNTTGFTALPGVVNTLGTLSITWTKAATYPLSAVYGTDYTVQTSDSLIGAWSSETIGGGNITISGNDVKYTFPAPLGTKKFARLKVTGP